MINLSLTIDGVAEKFSNTWIHMQDVGSSPASEYKVQIPKIFVNDVFRDVEIKEGASLNDSLMEEVCEDGPGVIGIYLDRVASLMGQTKQEKLRWVFATFTAAIEDDNGVELQGQVIPFDTDRFLQ